MTKLDVLLLLQELLKGCDYSVKGTGGQSWPADVVVDHECLMDKLAQAIEGEKP